MGFESIYPSPLLTRDLKVADLDEDGGTFGFGEGLVMTHVGTADPGASGVSAVLIPEHTFKDEDLLPADMGMGVETGLGRPTDQRGMLGEALMEGGDLEARHQALTPFQTVSGHCEGAFLGFGPVTAVLVKHTTRVRPEVQGLAREEADIRERAEGFVADQKAATDDQELQELRAVMRPGGTRGMGDDRNPGVVALPLAFQVHRTAFLADDPGIDDDALRMVGMKVHTLPVAASDRKVEPHHPTWGEAPGPSSRPLQTVKSNTITRSRFGTTRISNSSHKRGQAVSAGSC